LLWAARCGGQFFLSLALSTQKASPHAKHIGIRRHETPMIIAEFGNPSSFRY